MPEDDKAEAKWNPEADIHRIAGSPGPMPLPKGWSVFVVPGQEVTNVAEDKDGCFVFTIRQVSYSPPKRRVRKEDR
jgi:hypothetical protein